MAGAKPAWWGFHRLTERWARRLAEHAGIRPGELALDIGAGHGVITEALLARGARVIAVEAHPQRARQLRTTFTGRAVTVVQADAVDLRWPRKPFVVVANPPFAISTALLKRLLHPRSHLERAVLVLPSPVAARWAAGRAPGAQRWTREFVVRRTLAVPRTAFVPHPPRGAAVLEIRRRRAWA